MIDRTRWCAVLFTLVVCWLPSLEGQLASRIDRVDDGAVRLSFAARSGVCGSGGDVRVISNTRQSDDWESDCEPGPVRVVLRKVDGRVVEVDTYVGGRWRDRPGVTDLGMVSAPEAADYFLMLAGRLEGEVAKHAIFPATIADSVTIWPRLGELASDPSRPSDVRESALFWIGQAPEEDAADFLSEFLDGDWGLDLKERAVFALSQHESPRADRRLQQIAEDRSADKALREKAIFWLGQGGGSSDPQYLRALYDRLSDFDLKEKVIFALSQGGDADAEWLTRLALDDSEPLPLREKAIFWLGQVRNDDAVSLSDLYDRIDSRALRERVIFSLSQRHSDAALEKLIEIAREDEDRELRRKAIFWLGQSRDPRAAEFLAELIGS